MPKILLLALPDNVNQTPYLYDTRLFEFKSRRRLWSTPHLGLLTVGAMLSQNFNIDYIDLNYDVLTNFKYDFVFMSPSTSQAITAYDYANKFKQNNVKVIMGGPHVSTLPNEALLYANAVFIGEAEDTIKSFIIDVYTNKIKSIYITKQRPDLKKSPIPMYELAKKYPYKSIPVQLSRGCPHQCSFCLSSRIYGKYIRRKSVLQAKKELLYIKKLWDKPFIFFTDDNFLINESYNTELLKILEELKLEWYAFTDISIYKKSQLLNCLARSGCRKLLIGFESLNDKNLIDLNKSRYKYSKRHEYEKSVESIQKHKIGVIGSFVLGLNEDNEKTFDELYKFILDTCIYGTNITISTPFPGTDFYNKLSEKHTLTSNWADYDGFSLLHELPNITKNVFAEKYRELIQKINSEERISNVILYFKNLYGVS